jgi:hypothetical protein
VGEWDRGSGKAFPASRGYSGPNTTESFSLTNQTFQEFLMIAWHRLFGLALTDLFTNTKYQVELEKDLSIQQQFLDVVIIEQTTGPPLSPVPDGLETLAKHNLLTYKSFQETLNQWALKELVGHYTTYRKLVSPDLNHLLPEEDFRLYAATTRYPLNLEKPLGLTKRQTGVYDVECCHPIRLLVLGEFPPTPNNAFWQLFSVNAEKVLFGQKNYQWRQRRLSSVINQLFKRYLLEDLIMSYTVEDYVKNYQKDFLQELSVEERLAGLSPDEVLQRFSPDEVLQRFSPDEVLQRFSPDEVLQRFSPDEVLQCFSPDEVLQHFSLDQRLQGLSPDEIEAYLTKLKSQRSH